MFDKKANLSFRFRQLPDAGISLIRADSGEGFVQKAITTLTFLLKVSVFLTRIQALTLREAQGRLFLEKVSVS